MLIERARRLLETGGVAFETLPHREAYTAQGVAAAVHVSGWMLAKVLVVRAPGEGPVMVVLPASCRLDPTALARVLGKPNESLVPESERTPAPVLVMPDAPPMAPESVSAEAVVTASAAESVSGLARLCAATEALSCGAAPAKAIACTVMA